MRYPWRLSVSSSWILKKSPPSPSNSTILPSRPCLRAAATPSAYGRPLPTAPDGLEPPLQLADDPHVGDPVVFGKHEGLRENDGQHAIALERQPHAAVLAAMRPDDAEILVV